MRTRPVPSHPQYDDLSEKARSSYTCVVCGSDVREDKPHFVVHLIRGGATMLHPEDEAAYAADEMLHDAGNLGAQPVGPNCVRRFNLQEWVVRYDPGSARPTTGVLDSSRRT